jgi:hypothetical protein
MIDGKLLHGGLADRLYVIIKAFEFCKIKEIPFKIYFIYPFDIHVFLLPNKYDWSIEKNDISYNIRYARVMVRIQEEGWHKKLRFNKQVHFYCNTKNLEDINKYYASNFSYHELFNELFKPSESLQEKINSITNNILKKSYIGMHFRFKNSLGDFKELSYPALPKTEQKKLLELCYQSILPFISDSKIFLASESQIFLEYISKRLDKIYFIPGDTKIMDYDAPLSVHEKSFLDFFVLGSAKKIVSVCGYGLYPSGFSLFASQILYSEFEAINIDNV